MLSELTSLCAKQLFGSISIIFLYVNNDFSNFPIEVDVGPEFLTGSSRMKSGTAQKLILNMITTISMIRLGKVKGNKMVDMQLTNKKLNTRAVKIIVDELEIDEKTAAELLLKHKSVRSVLNKF